MKNDDILLFFLLQLVLSPAVLALLFLVLYKEPALLDTQIGRILLYTLSVLPIVIWSMRDQFAAIPTDLEETAMVDGLGIWGAFFTIILRIALPDLVAAFILCLVLTETEAPKFAAFRRHALLPLSDCSTMASFTCRRPKVTRPVDTSSSTFRILDAPGHRRFSAGDQATGFARRPRSFLFHR